jgi:hypothetical protein
MNFGPGKYAALNLMLARWLRTAAVPNQKYCYVTLGGSELYDVVNISWINSDLIDCALSYEQEKADFALAEATAARFTSKGIDIEVLNGDIFQYRRSISVDKPHVYYIDITKVFWLRTYQSVFKTWFDREVITPGDLVLVTSYLGARVPIKNRVSEFDAEFRKLGVSSDDEKARFYEVLHPSFVLSRSLLDAGLNDEIKLRSLGCIKYRANKEVMGLYGIVCENGKTQLAAMSSSVPCFDTLTRDWYELPTTV